MSFNLAYTEDSEWRNRTEFFKGRVAIIEFLSRKWKKEDQYKLMKELWSFTDKACLGASRAASRPS